MDSQKKGDAVDSCSSSSSSPRKMQQNDTTAESLSEDIIFFDILTRLPGTFLHRNAKFVCKAWAAIMGNSQFVEAHLRRAKPGIFLQSTRHPYGARFLEIKDNGGLRITELNPQYPGRILNSCDGLALFFQYATGALHVANPVTMQVTRVPDLLGAKLMYPPCAIARVPSTGEFKLFAAIAQKYSGVFVCHWYVLRLGIDCVWRKICTDSGDYDFTCSPIYNGAYDLYWTTKNRVIVMDIDKETFRAFLLPQELRWHPQYLKMGDCLSAIIFLEQGFQIHTFDAQSGKWTFYHHIGHLNYPTTGSDVLCEFFCAWMNQELIIKPIAIPSPGTLISGYNVKTRSLWTMNYREMGSHHLELHTISLISWKSALS